MEARLESVDILNSRQDWVETQQPDSIRTDMKSHQLQALTFMLQREQGWAWDGSRADLWELYSEADSYYINKVSGAIEAEKPPPFYGGILADPMGLGKTLSIISLIASDLLLDQNDLSSITGPNAEDSSGCTLIVVPPPLLGSWEEQLKQHIFPNRIPYRRHHGKSRLVTEPDLTDTLVVLTTYHTMSSDWKVAHGQPSSLLFSTKWRRIILDEAHFIRNSSSKMARAVCSLDSVSRWAVTGTPIQNKLSDLTALLKFLRVYPYANEDKFNTDISHLWKIGKVEEAEKRLKRLADCILLRRPKTVIQLPPRHDSQQFVELSSEERKLYQTAKMQIISHVTQALSVDGELNRKHSYANMLQRIEAMRMICNLGVYYKMRYNLEEYNEQTSQQWNEEAAQRMFNLYREINSIRCRLCFSTADSTENTFYEERLSVKSLFSQCLEFICSSCISVHTEPVALLSCIHANSCPIATVSTSVFEADDTSTVVIDTTGAELPTKVSMLIRDLQSQPYDVKCVVFSSWRTTLEIIEVGLKQSCIPCLRFDGKVAQKDRQNVIKRFREDPTIRVLLLTLSCGAVGLTLTEASRTYLMEPHWNPTLEDQALARIHRIGQTKEVTTVRFIVKDSFEERVVELQQSKTDLASIINLQENNGTRRPLELLKALI
ncbi:SNF2 family N-terminal domain-containing protein [Trichoderma evansii]